MHAFRIGDLLSGGLTDQHALAVLAGVSFTAMLTALAVTLLVGLWMVRAFKRKGLIEDTTQPDHAGLNAAQNQKQFVPTMGGLMILAGILATVALWADLSNVRIQAGLFCLFALGLLGFVDDYIKLRHHPARGLKKRTKLLFQFIIGLTVGYFLYAHADAATFAGTSATRVHLPFSTWPSVDLGWGYMLWAAFLITATSNAINLTDGLDGLAGGCVAIAAAALLACSIITSNPALAAQLGLPVVSEAPLLCVLIAATVGAALGFLWYNCHPARIFMGDTGALALGGLLAYVGLALKLDLLLLMIGLVFYADMLTVALQIVWFKLTRKRVFPIAPIHHYFQLYRLWPEQKITVRLWIVAALAAVASLATLRLG